MSQTVVMPPRIARLPRDKRGYPIPWNVLKNDKGEPTFTVNDDTRHFEALRSGLCPICGEALGKWKWFLGGPLSAFNENGWYLDLPTHKECAEFALATCPYLAAPKYLGRVDIPDPAKLPPDILLLDPTMIPERPDVFVAVAGRYAELKDNGPLMLPYVRPLKPLLGIQYWRHGERLSREEGGRLVRLALGEGWQEPETEAL